MISVVAFLSCLLLTVATSEAVVYAGYFLNAAGWGYGAITLVSNRPFILFHCSRKCSTRKSGTNNPSQSWINETYGDRPELRAFLIGTCQTLGATFSAWVPVIIFNVGKYAPSFHKGYIVVTVLAAVQVRTSYFWFLQVPLFLTWVIQFLLVFVVKWFTLTFGRSDEKEASADETENDASSYKASELV